MNNITNTAEHPCASIIFLDPEQTLDRVEELLCDTEFVTQAVEAFALQTEVFAAYVIAVLQGLPRRPDETLNTGFSRSYLGLYADEKTMRTDLLDMHGLAVDSDDHGGVGGALADLLHRDEEAIWNRFRDLFFIVPGKRGLHVFADIDDDSE